MRLWYGKEMEGMSVIKGTSTLFVETTEISETFAQRLETALRDHHKQVDRYTSIKFEDTGVYIESANFEHKFSPIKIDRLYLGAGRISPQEYDGLDQLINFCDKYLINLVLEIDVATIDKVPNWFRVNYSVIVRFDIDKKLVPHVDIKLDDGTCVYITEIDEMNKTDLKTLNENGLFDGDLLICECGGIS